MLLIVVYIILQIIYNEGRFTITLDSNKTLESGIAIYEKKDHLIWRNPNLTDGEKAEIYYTGAKSLLFIKTSIGIAGILPFNPMVNVEEKKTVIEAA